MKHFAQIEINASYLHHILLPTTSTYTKLFRFFRFEAYSSPMQGIEECLHVSLNLLDQLKLECASETSIPIDLFKQDTIFEILEGSLENVNQDGTLEALDMYSFHELQMHVKGAWNNNTTNIVKSISKRASVQATSNTLMNPPFATSSKFSKSQCDMRHIYTFILNSESKRKKCIQILGSNTVEQLISLLQTDACRGTPTNVNNYWLCIGNLSYIISAQSNHTLNEWVSKVSNVIRQKYPEFCSLPHQLEKNSMMQNVFRNLSIGERCLLIHENQCEHFLKLDKVHLEDLHDDETLNFPRVLFSDAPEMKQCTFCMHFTAQYRCVMDPISGNPEALACSNCMQVAFYDANDQVLKYAKDMKVFPYFGEEALLEKEWCSSL